MEFFQGIFTIAFVAILIAIVIAYHKRKKEKDSIPNKSAHKTCFDIIISEEFDIEDGVLKKYTGTSATVRIPNGVTQIGAEAFRKNTKLKRVHLPDSVRILGWDSFFGCTYLEQINIPINIEKVSQDAFSMCRLLRSAGMSSRFNIILDDAMDAIPDNLFRDMICLSEVSLPQKIKSIGKHAFYNCEKIKKIALPQNVKHIEEYAFSECSGLQEIILPPSLETVGASAFSDCKNLRSVVCQNNNTKFGTQAFLTAEPYRIRTDSLSSIRSSLRITEQLPICLFLTMLSGLTDPFLRAIIISFLLHCPVIWKRFPMGCAADVTILNELFFPKTD